eukprot:3922171-Alexandrium_andersonii.AAC.1
MSASLVGSEMCIRDRAGPAGKKQAAEDTPNSKKGKGEKNTALEKALSTCLLYTSDAADDM